MKRLSFRFILLFFFFTLVGCSNTEYPAEKSMIENQIFTSQAGHVKQLWFFQDELVIRDETNMELEEVDYGKYDLSTKKDTFYLKFDDGAEMTFKRVGKRLLEDEDGVIYQPQ